MTRNDQIGWIIGLAALAVGIWAIIPKASGDSTSLSNLATKIQTVVQKIPTSITTATGGVITSAAPVTLITSQADIPFTLPNGATGTNVDVGKDSPVDDYAGQAEIGFSTLMGLTQTQVAQADVQDTTGSSDGSDVSAWWNQGANTPSGILAAGIAAGTSPDQQGHFQNPDGSGTWSTTAYA